MCCVNPNQSLPFIQPVLITHKVMEIIGLSWHVIQDIAKRVFNSETFLYFSEIHESSHKVEPLLHSICFIGDIASMIKGEYFAKNQEDSPLLYAIKTAAKVCHTVSHLFSVASTVNDLKIVNLSFLKPVFKSELVLSVVGYGLWTISLIWETVQAHRRHEIDKHNKNDNKTPLGISVNFGIYGGGFAAESLLLSKKWSAVRDYRKAIGITSALLGIVHCVCSVYRIMKNMKKHSHDDDQH